METVSSSKCTVSSRASGGYCGGSLRQRTRIYASLSGGGVHWWRFLATIYWEWLQLRWVKNLKGFGFYL
jgi:hypothetical protein